MVSGDGDADEYHLRLHHLQGLRAARGQQGPQPRYFVQAYMCVLLLTHITHHTSLAYSTHCTLYSVYSFSFLTKTFCRVRPLCDPRAGGFSLELGLKDVALVREAAAKAGAPMPFASLLHDRLLAARERGRGEAEGRRRGGAWMEYSWCALTGGGG